MAGSLPNSPSTADQEIQRGEQSFLHTFRNGEIGRFSESELEAAFMLSNFSRTPANSMVIPPPSYIAHFDMQLALEAAKRKKEAMNNQICPPRFLCAPLTLEELLICNICGKQLSERSALIRHKQVHDEASKKFVCGVCGNAQRQRTNWKNHVVIHIGEDLSPEVYASLDEITKALVDGDERYVPRDLYEKRMEIARKRKMRFKVL